MPPEDIEPTLNIGDKQVAPPDDGALDHPGFLVLHRLMAPLDSTMPRLLRWLRSC